MITAAILAVVAISCRNADGTLSPCTRKLSGGTLGYHEQISEAERPAPQAAPETYYVLPAWGYSGHGHRGGRGHHIAPPARPSRPQPPRPPQPPTPPPSGGNYHAGRTR